MTYGAYNRLVAGNFGILLATGIQHSDDLVRRCTTAEQVAPAERVHGPMQLRLCGFFYASDTAVAAISAPVAFGK